MTSAKLDIYWADTKAVLSKDERFGMLQHALLESLDQDEILLREPVSGRLIVVRPALES